MRILLAALHHLIQRRYRFALPVAFKILRHIVHHRPNRQHVKVREQRLFACGKIFIADVAATDDGGHAVNGKALVVHTPIKTGKIGEIAERAQGAERERIKQANGDVRMAIQLAENVVQPHGVVVIQQQPHLHTAIGGVQQRAEQQAARHVVLPDVILHIQRLLGHLHQQIAGGKGVQAITERMNTAFARMASQPRRNCPCQPVRRGVLRNVDRLNHDASLS